MKYCKGCRTNQGSDQFQVNRKQCLSCRQKQNDSLASIERFEKDSRAKIDFKEHIKQWLKTDTQSRINELLPRGNNG